MAGFFGELRRRNVIRIGIAYLVLAWVLLQVGDVVFEALNLDGSANTLLLAILALGFIPALIFAWVFELTPEGLQKDQGQSLHPDGSAETAKKLDIVVIALLVLGIGVVLADRLIESPPDTAVTEIQTQPSDMAEPAIVSEPTASSDTALAQDSGLTGDKSIAVLPFANMSTDPENEFFADGVSEEILNRLAQVPGLRVIARTSSFAFKDQNQDLREIGGALDATYVLEGSVRRQGDQARITAQLIDGRDGSHLWSSTYDKNISNVFEAQDQIAIAVVGAMDVILDEQARQAMRNAGVRDVDAFVAYQRGIKAHQEAHNIQGENTVAERLNTANAWFDQAIERVPEFADAHLQKADRFAHIVLEPGHSDEEREAALESLHSLTELAYRHARDPARKAWARVDSILFSEDWRSLRAALEEALSIRSCTVGNWLELVDPFAYRKEITAHTRYLTECNPLFPFPYSTVARNLLLDGDYDAAQAVLDRGQRVAGNHNWIQSTQITAWLVMGDFQKMMAHIEAESSRRGPGWAMRGRAYVHALRGELDEARALFQQAEQISEESFSPTRRILIAAALGDLEAANQAAAELDARPGGYAELIRTINACDCGAPFTLDATPNLARRLRQAEFPWPPQALLDYPAKDW